jgi:glucosylceramidase
MDGVNPHELKEMPVQTMIEMGRPSTGALILDRSITHQTILGFGGAFTEASAVNWKKLSESDQADIIQKYYGSPFHGGHGYTMGRVPMGSCDFSLDSYSFDNVTGDVDMKYFDMGVSHDEENGMLPMMRAAQDMVKNSGGESGLRIFASPWSPPAWMKNAQLVKGKEIYRMDGSAVPLGLNKTYQQAHANYFSHFVSAYKAKGVDLWGVTVQNEAEFAAAWEASVYTPEFERDFVKNYLGPKLTADHPDLQIIGFDHNKDHVVTWADVLYGDDDAKKYLAGIGVHWYGGLNTEHLDQTHNIAPDKFLLATEACNCGGVVYQWQDSKQWWSRAEKLAIDMLEDLKHWCTGWIDWNLILDPEGGPNHAHNLCDANFIADPSHTSGDPQKRNYVTQASYWYMGHFSRFIDPGSKRIDLSDTIVRPGLTKHDIMLRKLRFDPCSTTNGSVGRGMAWSYDLTTRHLSQIGLCAQMDNDQHAITMTNCSSAAAQQWVISAVSGPTVGGMKRFINQANTSKCLTFEKTSGPAVGLDPGVDVNGGFVEDCGHAVPEQPQSFILRDADGKSFPDSFTIQTNSSDCLLPVNADTIDFAAVAFVRPSGDVAVVVFNKGEVDVTFDIYDEVGKRGAKGITVPKHAISSLWLTHQDGDVERELNKHDRLEVVV